MILSAQRYPCIRVLLPRTRLAYVHLRNLLSDAKRDRSARVSGYVAIWLPEETIVLYLRAGEVVNATEQNERRSRPIPIARALELVPSEPEYGEICFHEADEEMLACMFATHTLPPVEWPTELAIADPAILFPYLMSTIFDGVVEVVADGGVNYVTFHNGTIARTFLAAAHAGSAVDGATRLFARDGRLAEPRVRRWNPPAMLPKQAPPQLILAYRELAAALVQSLVAHGRDSAPAIAEHARQNLLASFPVLAGISFSGRPMQDPVADTESLTAGVAAWTREFMWTAADHDLVSPETLLREVTWERRHLFQSAGLYDQIPWKVL